MSIPFSEKPFRDLKSLARFRETARRAEEHHVRTTATQLLRYGVCPCIALGRYSTCCKQLHGDLTL